MQIVILGSGNVATVLGRLCKQKGHQVLQVVSRDLIHAKLLADELSCAYADFSGKINPNASLYLAAVSDTALIDLSNWVKLDHQFIVHTAGSVSRNVLQPISSNYGVLYPLQSLRKEMDQIPEIPFLIDANTIESNTCLQDFAKTLSGTSAFATDEERLKLHIAAVVVSNFTNHLYAMAEKYCGKELVDFTLLLPLIQETADRLQYMSPSLVQTGPAIRKDQLTIDKHLNLLNNHPQLKSLYLKLTESIGQG